MKIKDKEARFTLICTQMNYYETQNICWSLLNTFNYLYGRHTKTYWICPSRVEEYPLSIITFILKEGGYCPKGRIPWLGFLTPFLKQQTNVSGWMVKGVSGMHSQSHWYPDDSGLQWIWRLSMVGRDMKVILVGDQGQYLLTFENWESCHRQGGNFHEVASISSAWFPLEKGTLSCKPEGVGLVCPPSHYFVFYNMPFATIFACFCIALPDQTIVQPPMKPKACPSWSSESLGWSL